MSWAGRIAIVLSFLASSWAAGCPNGADPLDPGEEAGVSDVVFADLPGETRDGAALEAGWVLLLEASPVTVGGEVTVELAVPANVQALHITASGRSDSSLWICGWTRSGETLVHDGWWSEDDNWTYCRNCMAHVSAKLGGTTAVTIPNGDQPFPLGGEHKVTLCASDGGFTVTDSALTVRVRGRTTPTPERVEIRLVVVLGSDAWGGLEAAAKDQRLAAALSESGSILGAAGVTVSLVDIIEAPADLRVTGEGQVDGLRNLLTGHGGRVIPILVIDDTAPAGLYLGQAGNIPGPLIPGTSASGVVLALDAIDGDERSLGLVLAHELGHYLGLWHITDVLSHDPLTDTPDDDPNYLMHWAPLGTKLSERQGEIIRGSALAWTL